MEVKMINQDDRSLEKVPKRAKQRAYTAISSRPVILFIIKS